MKSFCSVLLLSFALVSCAQKKSTSPTLLIYSEKVKDSFEIYITVPKRVDTVKQLSVMYYLDANINSGKKLREMISRPEFSDKVNKTIFVGIGHLGDFHVLRRRDFILPEIKNGDTAGASVNYGQIENFYQFLKTELIPFIDSTYKINSNNNSILGHSFGGLFAFYCLFKNDTLFKNFYALSPSLWVDNYAIYKFNRLTRDSLNKKFLYFSSGSLEIFNRIKAGTDDMDLFLQKNNYPNLSYKYEIHSGKTHNSQVENSLNFILKQN
jgi:predicted alpha/beta superfamily hydrolase